MKLPKIPLLVLDTETTGFVPAVHHVMEFACVRFYDGKVTDEVEQLYSLEDGNDIPLAIQMLTHITPADLEGKPTFTDFLPTIASLVEADTVIVGQNVQFDLGMLRGEGWDLTEQPWIDTSMLASLVFPELHSYSLGYMSDALGLDHTPRHRALGDVRATAELLEKCVERLLSLPHDELETIRGIAEKGPRGYRQFFASLGASSATKKPSWLGLSVECTSDTTKAISIPPPERGVVQLVDEPLSPSFVQGILRGAEGQTWVAVKNIEAAVRRFDLPKKMTVLYPPEFLIDESKVKTLLQQPEYTADEMTIAMKTFLYNPDQRTDLPLHGGEYQVWEGKLGAGESSPAYTALLAKAFAGPTLVSHAFVLSYLDTGSTVLPADLHLIVDDASMLEDTATNAFEWTCFLPTLRAAAQGSDTLMRCTDTIELWTEKTRSEQTLRYIAPSDLETRESTELRRMLTELLADTSIPAGVRQALDALLLILDPENLPGRITWIDAYQDGSKTIKSVPENIAKFLTDKLYSSLRTTLLIPPYSSTSLSAFLSDDVDRKALHVPAPAPDIAVALPLNQNIESLLKTRSGKTILLVSSKRTIEDIYVRYGKPLDDDGVTLLCQGFAGGKGRMQAEFELAKSPAFLVMTPWMYEGIELPAGTVDRLAIQVMPFDHPSHAVVSRRAARYRDPFNGYSLPRLKHRLFRLLRTFSRHAVKGAEVLVLDDRLRTKGYGKEVSQYLLSLGAAEGKKGEEKVQMELL